MIYQAKDYKDRKALDFAVRHRTKEEDEEIQGTWQELSDKSLSESSLVWGVKVKITE